MKFQHRSGREAYPLVLAQRESKEKTAVAHDQPDRSEFCLRFPEDRAYTVVSDVFRLAKGTFIDPAA
jgi:hypothetical protein